MKNNRAVKRFLKNKAAVFSLAFVLFMIFLGLFGETIVNAFLTNANIQVLEDRLLEPSMQHFFGTDHLGRDLFARVLSGTKVSLMIGFFATFITVIIGVFYGAFSALKGGAIDNWMMRIVDILYSVPFIFLVILLLSLFNASMLLLFVALGAVQWLTMARVIRGEVLSIKEREFITAQKALGSSFSRILFKHVLPNVAGIIIIYATLTVPVVILQESFLSFLGLTVPGQEHSWGVLMSEGVNAANPVKIYWWLIVFPGLAITLTLLSLNFLGDGLRDAFDPKEKR